MAHRRFWLALHPDIRRPIGGIKQVHRLAEALCLAGRQATLVQGDAEFHPGWFRSQVATIALDQFRQQPLDPARDVVVLPETFLPVLPRYAAGIPKWIFNQNGAYSFGLKEGDGFPSDPREVLSLYTHRDLRLVLCVSAHDHQLLNQGFGLSSECVVQLPNPLETDQFLPGPPKHKWVSWMPRKHARDGAIVGALLERQPGWQDWRLQPIADQSHAGVAALLQQSLVFLAFGHPEGFGLPIAEALAAGCYVIGYSGLGGRELLAIAQQCGAGEEVAFGDWTGFVMAFGRLQQRLHQDPHGLRASLTAASRAIRARYSPETFRAAVAAGLPHWEALS